MAQDAYVFGYGSLIERASRTRTNPDAVGAWPARVTGYRRGWFHQFTKSDNVASSCTYLGAIEPLGQPSTASYITWRISRKPNSGKPATAPGWCPRIASRCWTGLAPGTATKMSTSLKAIPPTFPKPKSRPLTSPWFNLMSISVSTVAWKSKRSIGRLVALFRNLLRPRPAGTSIG